MNELLQRPFDVLSVGVKDKTVLLAAASFTIQQISDEAKPFTTILKGEIRLDNSKLVAEMEANPELGRVECVLDKVN